MVPYIISVDSVRWWPESLDEGSFHLHIWYISR